MKTILQSRFDKMREAINLNARFLDIASQEYRVMFSWKSLPSGDSYLDPFTLSCSDISKLRSTLRQVVREWSENGRAERDATFAPLVSILETEHPNKHIRKEIKILCPGCGLGRLPFEIACRGFAAQGNEFSYQMLIVSNFIMNEIEGKDAYRVAPNIHCLSNRLSQNDIFQTYFIPDIDLSEAIKNGGDLSMATGEFLEVYSDTLDYWDAVVTCFFIDTAHNIVDYIKAIYKMLKPGGLWINLGPLLYHYADMPNQSSIELTWQEVLEVAKQVGFKLESEQTVKSGYCGGGPSMLEAVYSNKLIKARK